MQSNVQAEGKFTINDLMEVGERRWTLRSATPPNSPELKLAVTT